ncbi:outer membrane beta-barrel protein [Adhaeribacter radiodurans]|uniref:Outer membrane beta-barrel protein n=1 Tax=Adhaeribacter radiodurans TaxID=2745197 RepID=A0A7L7L7A1_9BACT|nr:outer membrane beta-barrel protein [Adhaeribacter radiodurans]QMU28711.1 outer membrane beta-barrel protein [Adhaeribacter radiodurans]
MKRILIITALFWVAATAVSLANGLAAKPKYVASLLDTIQINLADGASLTLQVKNTSQLKNFQKYSLDSLMVLLNKYVQQVESMSKSSPNGSAEISMTFYPAKDLNNPNAPEQIKIKMASGNSGSKQTWSANAGDLVKVEVDYEDDEDDDDHNGSVYVNVKTRNDSLRKEKMERKMNRRHRFFSTIDLGLNTFVNVPELNNSLYDLKPIGSRYISLNQYISTRIGGVKSPLKFRTGLELAFNNYMLDKNRRITDENNTTVFYNESTLSLEKSKLTTSSLNLPVIIELNFKDKNGKESFKIGGGGFVGYRLGSHTKIKYQSEGNTYKDKERGNYNLEDMQYGVNFLIGYKWINLFAKYNLNDLFKDNRGPKMNVVSFGFRI